MDVLEKFANTLGFDPLAIGRGLFRIAVIVAIAIVIDRVVRSQVESTLARRSLGRSGALLIVRAISIGIYAVSILMIFGTFGATWTGLLTVVSASTVAIALAVQDVLKNFVSGVFLLLERPFRTGDHIKVRGVEGEVQGIDVRTTLVRESDGSLTMVPNSIVFTEVLTNRSRRGTRRIDLKFTVPGSSIRDAEAAICEALREVPSVRSPLPAPLVRSVTKIESIFTLSVLVDNREHAEREVVQSLVDKLGQTSVEMVRE